MFCPKCGTQLPDNAVFCGKCGAEIPVSINLSEPERARRNVHREGRHANPDEKYADPYDKYANPDEEYADRDGEYTYSDEDVRKDDYAERPDPLSRGKSTPRRKTSRKKSRLPLVLLLLLLLVLGAAAFLFWQLQSRQAKTGSGADLQAADEPMQTSAAAEAVTPSVTSTKAAEKTPEAAASATPEPAVSGMSAATAAATSVPTATATPTPTPIPEPAPSRLIPAQITASSTLGYDGDNYFPEYVNDDNPVTAWAEGVSGNGEGQSLVFAFPAGTKLTGCEVMPGFFKNDDLFSKNSAPSALLISTGGNSVTADVSEYANSWHGSSSLQTVTFSTPLICDGAVTVSIQAVRGGWKYTDTLISEFHFFGVPAQYVSGSAADGTKSSQTEGEISGNGGTEASGQAPAAAAAVREPEDEEISMMASMAGWVYRRRMGQSGPLDADITVSSLTAEEKAFLLYWYQYHGGDEDGRIQSQMEYNLVSAQDLRSMLGELTGETPEDAMQVFSAQYVQMQEGDLCYMYGTGDFGDAGPFYFGDGQMTVENGRICITGSVMTYDTGAGSYVPGKTYRAYYSTEGGATGNPCIPYPFAEVSVSG